MSFEEQFGLIAEGFQARQPFQSFTASSTSYFLLDLARTEVTKAFICFLKLCSF